MKKKEKEAEVLCERVKEAAELEGIHISIGALKKLIDIYEEEKWKPLFEGHSIIVPNIAELRIILRHTMGTRIGFFMTASLTEAMKKKVAAIFLSHKSVMKRMLVKDESLTTDEITYIMKKYDIQRKDLGDGIK